MGENAWYTLGEIDWYIMGRKLTDPKYYQIALQFAECLWEFWYIRGPWKNAREWLKRTLDVTQSFEISQERASVLNGLAVFALSNSQMREAQSSIDESLTVSKQLRKKQTEGEAYNTLGWYASAYMHTDIDAAKKYYEMSLEAFREAEHVSASLWPLRGIGDCLVKMDMDDKGDEYFQRARSIGEQSGNSRGLAFICLDLGGLATKRKEFHLAFQEYYNGLKLWSKLQEGHSFVLCLEAMANFVNEIDRPSKAATLYCATRAIRGAIRIPPWYKDMLRLDKEHDKLKIHLGEKFKSAESLGLQISKDQNQILLFVEDIFNDG